MDDSVNITDDKSDDRSTSATIQHVNSAASTISAAQISSQIEKEIAANPTAAVIDINLGNEPSLDAAALIALCEKNNVAKRCHFTHKGMKFVLYIPVIDVTSDSFKQCMAMLDLEPGKQAGPIRLSLLFAPVGFSVPNE